MVPWIQVQSNLITHPKTARLAEELKLTSSSIAPTVQAAGILVALWSWAVQNAYDGDLSKTTASAIADACRWKKKPETLIAALKKVGYIDPDLKLHDWEEYAVRLIDQEEERREKTRERVRKYREKKSGNVTPESVTCNGYSNVTDTPCNAPTLPNHTIPNNTMSNSGGGGEEEIARAHEDDPDGPVENFAEYLLRSYAGRGALKPDLDNVASCLNQGWSKEVIETAFSIASENGKVTWPFVFGVLKNFKARHIETIGDALEYEALRDQERGL